jgi:hypothetical protein
VKVDGPLSKVIAAGKGHVGLATASKKRTQNDDRRTHRLEQMRRGDGMELVRRRHHDG